MTCDRGRLYVRFLTRLVTAAMALGAGSTALAQQRVEARGDALDANNRVGDARSYGVPRRDISDRFRLNNAIVTGDVTGARGFRDFVPYRSERSFRDFGAGRLTSDFIGRSSGAMPSGTVINNAQVLRPYYGSSQVVAPLGDYTRLPGTGGYVPSSAFVAQPGTVGRPTALEGRVNLRLDRDDPARDYGRTYWDTLNDSALMSPTAQNVVGRARVLSPYTTLSRDTRLEPLTAQRLAELQSELRRDPAAPLDPEARDAISGARPAEGATGIGEQTAMGDRRAQSGAEGAVPLQPLAENARQRLEQSLQRTGEIELADPAQQSSQYAQLRDRLQRLQESGVLDSQRPVGAGPRDDPFAPAQPIPQREPGAVPGQPETPPQQPGQQAQPQQPGAGQGLPDLLPPRAYPVPGAQTRTPADQPLVISSLAEGVASASLRRMYEEAEALMDEGRYVSAIARYDAASRLVPNQPLTLLGRASAELGAGYYRRCAQTLQAAFQQSPELMMARLDLPGLIGQKRLDEVTQTLGQRLAASAEDPDPAFLLAFIAYHSGNTLEAARMLSTAQQRSGAVFFGEVAAHWGVAGGAPATQPAPSQD